MMNIKKFFFSATALLFVALYSDGAYAESTLSNANTAWILTSTALVLFMTLPGLAFFMED